MRVVGGAGLAVVALIAAFAIARCGSREHDSSTHASPAVERAIWTRLGSAAPERSAARAAPAGGLRLEGQVVDEHDRPLAGARVVLFDDGARTTSGADGSFAFEHLAPS